MKVSNEIRICYQSFVDDALGGAYLDYLRTHIEDTREPGTEFEIVTLSPPDHYAHAAMEVRCGYQAMRNAIRAERSGVDAFVFGHFQDPLLAETKAVLDIPVLGLGEISMLHACTLGRKIGLITINPRFIPWHEEQIVTYGLERRVVSVHAMEFAPEDFMKSFESDAHYRKVRDAFCEQAEPLVKAGIDVLIPAGGIPMMVLSKERGFNVGGVPVLDGITLLVKSAELAVKLYRLNGTSVSRRGAFIRPPAEVIDELLEYP